MDDKPQFEWDAFISYASEDRDAIARPLSQLLKTFGLKVWIDQTELKVGDSLRERVDAGLAKSEYGIVVLSSNFFSKHYPQRELNGLANREVDGNRVLLPVWHGISVEEVRKYSPPLADRIAVNTSEGLTVVATRLLDVIWPDWAAAQVAKVTWLAEVDDPGQMVRALVGCHAHLFFPPPKTSTSTRKWLREIADLVEHSDVMLENLSDQFQYEEYLEPLLSKGRELGFSVFVGRRRQRLFQSDPNADWEAALIAIVPTGTVAATVRGNTLTIMPPRQS